MAKKEDEQAYSRTRNSEVRNCALQIKGSKNTTWKIRE